MSNAKPIVAIVGRPNVGKSTLFNRLVGRRAAIVEDMPGVTRDRQYGDACVLDKDFIVIDTGGFEPKTDDEMLMIMREQAEIAIEEADVIIVMFDGRDGLLPADEEIARMMMRGNKPVHWAVNKIDGFKQEPLGAEFWAIGMPELHTISAQHAVGVLDMMELVIADFPEDTEDDAIDDDVIKVAIIGKPNAGKSTLLNKLLGEERMLVSELAGTTRDSIDSWFERTITVDPSAIAASQAHGDGPVDADDDSEFAAGEIDDPAEIPWDAQDGRWKEDHLDEGEWGNTGAPQDRDDDGYGDAFEAQQDDSDTDTDADGPTEFVQRYLMIDTAGVRRRKWIKEHVEKISVVRTFKAIDRADVCLLVIDATEGVTDQDAKLAGLIADKGRGCIILLNKWDVVKDKHDRTFGSFVKGLRHDLHHINWAPILSISAKTGQRTHRIMDLVDEVAKNRQRRIKTGEINRTVDVLVESHTPPVHKGRRLKFYYAAQVASGPPVFVMWVNDPGGLQESYKRFLINRMRMRFNFEGTPIKLIARARTSKPKK